VQRDDSLHNRLGLQRRNDYFREPRTEVVPAATAGEWSVRLNVLDDPPGLPARLGPTHLGWDLPFNAVSGGLVSAGSELEQLQGLADHRQQKQHLVRDEQGQRNPQPHPVQTLSHELD